MNTTNRAPTYFEEEYMLARFEAAMCRAMGHTAEMRDAIRRAWKWRRAVRLSSGEA